MSEFVPFCPCCQTYHTDDKHQKHCLLGHAEQRIEELEQRLAAKEAKNKSMKKIIEFLNSRLNTENLQKIEP